MEEPPHIEGVLSSDAVLPSDAASVLAAFVTIVQKEEDEEDHAVAVPEEHDEVNNSSGETGDVPSLSSRKADAAPPLGVTEETIERLRSVRDALSGRARPAGVIGIGGGASLLSRLIHETSSEVAYTGGGRRRDDAGGTHSPADEAAGGGGMGRGTETGRKEERVKDESGVASTGAENDTNTGSGGDRVQQQRQEEEGNKERDTAIDRLKNEGDVQPMQQLTPKEIKKKKKKERKREEKEKNKELKKSAKKEKKRKEREASKSPQDSSVKKKRFKVE